LRRIALLRVDIKASADEAASGGASVSDIAARDDAGFTLTEMAASLLVAAMLVSGLGEITRQFARTIVRTNADLQLTRASRIAGANFLALERAEPGAVSVTDMNVETATGAGLTAPFQMTVGVDGARTLTWGRTPSQPLGARDARRSITLPATARFEQNDAGVIRLWLSPDMPPLLVVDPRREAAFDCRYDVVARRCR